MGVEHRRAGGQPVEIRGWYLAAIGTERRPVQAVEEKEKRFHQQLVLSGL